MDTTKSSPSAAAITESLILDSIWCSGRSVRLVSYLLDAVAVLEVHELIPQAEKRLGSVKATVLSEVLGDEVEHGRNCAKVVVCLKMKFDPFFVHVSSITH